VCRRDEYNQHIAADSVVDTLSLVILHVVARRERQRSPVVVRKPRWRITMDRE
jgi:hypothetical protein